MIVALRSFIVSNLLICAFSVICMLLDVITSGRWDVPWWGFLLVAIVAWYAGYVIVIRFKLA